MRSRSRFFSRSASCFSSSSPTIPFWRRVSISSRRARSRSPRVTISPLHLATISSTTAVSAAAKPRAHAHPDPSTRRGTNNFILSIMDERARDGDWGLGVRDFGDWGLGGSVHLGAIHAPYGGGTKRRRRLHVE